MTHNPRKPTPNDVADKLAALIDDPPPTPVTAGIPIPAKPIILHQLQAEMLAAGLSVRMLGTSGKYGRLFDHDASGVPIDLPPGAQAVIAAHVPTPAIDFGPNAEALDRARVQAYITASNTFLGTPNASVTQAMVLAQVQRNTKALLTLIRMARGTNG